jgi:putative methanogenesis marker protein 12
MSNEEIIDEVEKRYVEIDLIALTYSMGDGFSTIKDIKEVKNRGLRSEKVERVAGTLIGGGTKVFDAIKASGIPTIMIPGIHANSKNIDYRMKFFSHCASPEKVGIAYHIHKKGFEHFVFSDISSNTVTGAVARGVIIGAIDACIFAPGLYQGPIDLQFIRDIEAGMIGANEAFSNAGVCSKKAYTCRCSGSNEEVLDVLSLFAAMEIAALGVIMRDYDVFEHEHEVFLTGSVGEKEEMKMLIDRLLNVNTKTVTRYSAAIGCAQIARDVFGGKKDILGIEVEYGSKNVE